MKRVLLPLIVLSLSVMAADLFAQRIGGFRSLVLDDNTGPLAERSWFVSEAGSLGIDAAGSVSGAFPDVNTLVHISNITKNEGLRISTNIGATGLNIIGSSFGGIIDASSTGIFFATTQPTTGIDMSLGATNVGMDIDGGTPTGISIGNGTAGSDGISLSAINTGITVGAVTTPDQGEAIDANVSGLAIGTNVAPNIGQTTRANIIGGTFDANVIGVDIGQSIVPSLGLGVEAGSLGIDVLAFTDGINVSANNTGVNISTTFSTGESINTFFGNGLSLSGFSGFGSTGVNISGYDNPLVITNPGSGSTAIKIFANGGVGINIDPASNGIMIDATNLGIGIGTGSTLPLSGMLINADSYGMTVTTSAANGGKVASFSLGNFSSTDNAVEIANQGLGSGLNVGSQSNGITVNSFGTGITVSDGVSKGIMVTESGFGGTGVDVNSNGLFSAIGINVSTSASFDGNPETGINVTTDPVNTVAVGVNITSSGRGIVSTNGAGSASKAAEFIGNDAASGSTNTALQVTRGEITVGRRQPGSGAAGGAGVVYSTTPGDGGTNNGPSGIVEVAANFPAQGATANGAVQNTGIFQLNSEYITPNSIVIFQTVDNLTPFSTAYVNCGPRAAGNVLFTVFRLVPPAGDGAEPTVRVAYTIINPDR
jgi:hypothetical protein